MSPHEIAEWKSGIVVAERLTRDCLTYASRLEDRIAKLEADYALLDIVELMASR